MKKDFYRISQLPPYVFAQVNAKRALERSKGRDIIDLGMGNPDSMPPQKVIDKLSLAAHSSNIHSYSISKGIKRSKKSAMCILYKKIWSRA